MKDEVVRLFVRNGIKITECHNVYRPREDSELLSEAVERLAEGKVLDVGTGTGIQGIIAAKKGCDVTFSDVSTHAIRCARQNASQNNVKGTFIVSDLFDSISGKFDTIIFNPPYLESARLGAESGDYVKLATDGGENGRELIDRFIAGSFSHMTKSGRVIMIESSVNNYELDIQRLGAKLLGRRHVFFEDMVVISYKNNKKSGGFKWK
jgi:release factor glutamine methyltransferase